MAKRRLVIENASIVTLDPRLGDIRDGGILRQPRIELGL